MTIVRPYISIISFIIILTSSISIFAQEQFQNKENTDSSFALFNGFHLGIGPGMQNIFGGALIDSLDLLGQKSGLVIEFSAGYRRQFLKNRLLLGGEVSLGITDGDLTEVDARNQFNVLYKNKFQFAYGITLGLALGSGRGFLIYSYANMAKRNFNTEYKDADDMVINQMDGQQFLQYGIGLETPIKTRLNLRISAGLVDVDFGELLTSQDVEDLVDIKVALVFHFYHETSACKNFFD